jgi:hypothetical protein
MAKIGSRKRILQKPQKRSFLLILQGLKLLLNFVLKKLNLTSKSFKIAKIGYHGHGLDFRRLQTKKLKKSGSAGQ